MRREVRVHRHILSLIMSCAKDLEVRVAIPYFKQVQVNDTLVFSPNCVRYVKAIRTYQSFDQMLKSENPERIGPGYTATQILSELQCIYPTHLERLGVIVFELVTEEK